MNFFITLGSHQVACKSCELDCNTCESQCNRMDTQSEKRKVTHLQTDNCLQQWDYHSQG